MTTEEPLNRVHEMPEISVQPEEELTASHLRPPTPSRWRLWLGALILFFALAVFYGIRSRQQAESRLQARADDDAVPTVNVISPKAGAAAEEIALPGNTLAFNETPIYARSNGYLKKWYADIGARVRAGDLLAEIEVPELDQQLHQAEADLASARTNLDLAKLTNTRWQDLLVHRVVSAQEADQVKSDFGVKQAAYLAGDANVRRLQEMQKYERVVAPFDGVVTVRNTDIGALVESGPGTAGRELFHLAAVHKLRVYVAVPEVYAEGIRDGSEVTLTQSANASRTFTGTVVRNASAIDQTTRTLNVEIDVNNEDGRLLPGSYVFVHMKLPGQTGSVTIPANALLFRSEGLRAARVVAGKVTLVPITIGHDFGSTIEVTSGLSASDVVVVDPSDSLADGTKVEVNTPAQNVEHK
jgi:RND family efflux transporter MFP subunit